MFDYVRMIAMGGTIGAIVAGSLAAPSLMAAVAEEPVQAVQATVEKLFPPAAIDPKIFSRYDITFDESVSTDVQSVRTIKKIGHGRTSYVSIVTTPSGTYSTDAVTSPHVRYPGIEVKANGAAMVNTLADVAGEWISQTKGSITYITFVIGAART